MDSTAAELLNPVARICRIEIARAVKGQALWEAHPPDCEARASANRGDLHNRAVVGVCSEEIARPVKSQADWYMQVGDRKDRAHAARAEFLDRAHSLAEKAGFSDPELPLPRASVRHVEVARAVKGQAERPIQAPETGEVRSNALRRELQYLVSASVGHVEIARVVKGQAMWRAQAAVRKDRADSAGGKLHNSVVAAVRHVEIASAVEGHAGWFAQATAGKDRTDSTAGDLRDRVIATVRHIEDVRAAGGREAAEQKSGNTGGEPKSCATVTLLVTRFQLGHVVACNAPLHTRVTGRVARLSPPLSHERSG